MSEGLKTSHGQMIDCSFRVRPERHPEVIVFDDIADADTMLRNMAEHLRRDPAALTGGRAPETPRGRPVEAERPLKGL
ncbi:hypothetical protein G7043_27980 [Lentzea sp. NEAU-D13]|uniref:Uncharacterized protein n=1 Tax=Lentzea alba TaxID=2714351 RepID=A0A7C9RVE2_9PSEU|nr:hypothetical protein [Lentzea alba]NGY62763.1 hypothetical protein [Lentzea alba]